MTTLTRAPDRITRVVRAAEITELTLQQTELRAMDADRLRAELVALHRPGHPARIILSLAGMGMLSGPCLGMLTEVAEGLARAGGSLVLSEVPPEAARVLKRSGLARKLPVARSPDHARRLAGAARKHTNQAA